MLALLTCPPRHAGAPGAARGLDVAAAHFGTEGRAGVLDLGLAPLASEAKGAGAEEAGGQGRGRAGGARKGGKQGLAAAPVLAELGILAGVRKLARLSQEARGTLAGPLPLRWAQAGASVGTGSWETPTLQPSRLDDRPTQQEQQRRQQQ